MFLQSTGPMIVNVSGKKDCPRGILEVQNFTPGYSISAWGTPALTPYPWYEPRGIVEHALNQGGVPRSRQGNGL